MPNGLQVWDAGGVLRLDTSARVGTFIGTINTGTSNGSAAIDTSKGTPWAYVSPLNEPSLNAILPDIRLVGNVVYWEFPSVLWGSPVPAIITFGVF